MNVTAVDPRYPVGKFEQPETITLEDRSNAIASLAEMPEHLRNAVEGLSSAQLNTPYREGGWTVRQLAQVLCHQPCGVLLDRAVRRHRDVESFAALCAGATGGVRDS